MWDYHKHTVLTFRMLYHIDPNQGSDFYVSGTSEVGIAGFFTNHAISVKHLPLKICCVSTCNRKETGMYLQDHIYIYTNTPGLYLHKAKFKWWVHWTCLGFLKNTISSKQECMSVPAYNKWMSSLFYIGDANHIILILKIWFVKPSNW